MHKAGGAKFNEGRCLLLQLQVYRPLDCFPVGLVGELQLAAVRCFDLF
jgi:hypothetical protein